MKHRLISLITALALCLSLCPPWALAAEASPGWTYDTTTGTLTIAVNSLVKKGYVDRARSEEDRRVVLISLSEKGRKAYLHHQQFHEQMIEAIVEELTQEEKVVLEKALVKLDQFFRA